MSLGTWWTDLLKKPEPEEKDHLIAVVGVLGAGKSTFINRAVGGNDLKTSGPGGSSTTGPTFYPYKQNGKKVTLIDTPGFDTDRSDADILKNIAKFLGGRGDQRTLLSGIILLQPIEGVKMQTRLIRLIEDVIGTDNFERVILATTKWTKLKKKKEGLAKQEKWRAEKNCWGRMAEHGAQIVKHDDNKSSARKIVGMILDIKKPPTPLQLQLELAANQLSLASTTAGVRIMKELDKSTNNLIGELNLARKKQSEAVNDHGSQLQDEVNKLRDEFNKLQDEIKENEKEQEQLKSTKVHSEKVQKVLVKVAETGVEAAIAATCTMS